MAPPNKENIQGDIWPRLPKKHEVFVFFRITNPIKFKKDLAGLVPLLTTAKDAEDTRADIYKKKANGTLKGLIELSAINIAFSAKGLAKLVKEGFKDDIFNNGMWEDLTYPLPHDDKAKHNGLDDQNDWYHQFTPRSGYIDGVFIITGDSKKTLTDTHDMIKKTFGVNLTPADQPSIQHIFEQQGHVLPDDREHFGWVDGISQPIVYGLDTDQKIEEAKKGLKPIQPGTILVGTEGDQSNHPSWAKEGSFMVFRTYEQRTPEFVKWCAGNIPRMATEGIKGPGVAEELRRFSSRVVGRWPDGAPLELHPIDDPSTPMNPDPQVHSEMLEQKWKDEGKDPKVERKKLEEINHTDAFTYHPDDQKKCPYAAHIRKCGPRDDFPNYEKHLMMRRGIPYGEVTGQNEKAGFVSQKDRGLLFVSYQSSIENGFRFVQKVWANEADKPVDFTNKLGNHAPQGIDAIIGQVAPDMRHKEDVTKYKKLVLANFPDIEQDVPDTNEFFIPIERWVIPRGGEYFFAPSISGLQDTLCK